MKSRYFFITCIFICLIYSQNFSQTPSYYHYTSSDGLASSTVYQIIQGKDGFIWFATANGLSKFDGNHFTTFRTSDGLNSNSIISLAEGKNGELYIGTFEKGINLFRNGQFENYCSEIEGKSFDLSYLLLVPSQKREQNILAYNRWGNLKLISENKTIGLVTNVINTSPELINKVDFLPNGDLIALTTKGLFNLKNNVLSKIHINGFPDRDAYCLTQAQDGSYLIGTKAVIYRIKENNVIGSYKVNIAGNNEVVAILCDKNNNVWFSIMNRGCYLIPNGSNKIIDIGSKLDLKKTLVNNYFEDNEGNIWISTFGKGVYCINNLHVKNYNEQDGLSSNNVYSIVKERSGNILIGTFAGVNFLEDGRFNQVKNTSNKFLTEYIYSIKKNNNEFYICSASGRNEIINFFYKGIKMHMFDGLSFCKLKNGLFLFGMRSNSIRIQREINHEENTSNLFYVFGETTNVNRVNEIFEDTKENVWIGTGLGLCKVTHISNEITEWKKSFFPANQVLNSRIYSIAQDNVNNVWFAGEKGIASYNISSGRINTHQNLFGIDLSNSTSIAFDNRNRIWLGNMKGLYLFDGNSIKIINKQTGLPSDEILSLCYDNVKNVLFIGTSNGLSLLDIDLFDKQKAPSLNVKILNIKAGDTVFTNHNYLVFNPEQKHVFINFRVLLFSSPGSIRYKYCLNGEWAETDHDYLDLVSLENGKYELLIMAKSQNSNWGKPTKLIFEVLPRFIETIWYKIGIISMFVLLAVSIVAWRLKQKSNKIREELELTERINELKHQALSAMMNPHFIFNSLNSVQYLINCQRNEEANDYIATMAKLIRKNLDTAGRGFILLEEEISRLKLYLDLEKLRFQDSFSYEIIIGTDVDTATLMIPNMIIQPFVENTLWHGIINSGVKGVVTISFTFEEVEVDSVFCRSLIIKIADNGIGIKEAKKNKKADHISKGIEIIEERLRLLSTRMLLPKPIMFEDLSSRSENSHGTEVIISLPPPLYKVNLQKSDSATHLPINQ